MNYKELTKKINLHILNFNTHIQQHSAAPCLEWGNPDFFMQISATPWDEQFWPNKDSKGLYFLFLKNSQNANDLALYIGLASLANIGTRLNSHLNQPEFRSTGIYKDYDTSGKEYVIDWVGTIDFSSRGLAFLAPALEEYLISKLSQEIHLTNKKGIVK